jgi:hypothetical protein
VSARAVATGVALLAALLLAGCSSEPRPVAPAFEPHGPPIDFAFGTPSGAVVSSNGTRGRVTALLFVASFDLPSQVMAKRLDEVVRRHQPRANAAAVALEAPNDAPLLEVFRTSLDLSYPVALANTTHFDPEQPFGEVDQVPTLVLLDRRGREVARAHGVITARELDDALTAAGR